MTASNKLFDKMVEVEGISVARFCYMHIKTCTKLLYRSDCSSTTKLQSDSGADPRKCNGGAKFIN